MDKDFQDLMVAILATKGLNTFSLYRKKKFDFTYTLMALHIIKVFS